MNVSEAAKRLNVHERTVRNMMKDGRLEAEKKGGEWDISIDSVNAILGKYENEANLVKVELQVSNYIDQKTNEIQNRIRAQAKNFIDLHDQGNANALLWAQKIADEVHELNRLRSAQAVISEAIQDEFTPFEDEEDGEI